ncbi:hypothetical protein CJ030_MR2G000929 [Morella rubra]|uniref:RNase H type-1 domain-containing protein n=1 Tax=Morella rubra TaxID=262757 RepID=A0A6A1WKA8_9ROSI|nr:hypothetical protein CJ030_MR2G000929 [Morella rubra]
MAQLVKFLIVEKGGTDMHQREHQALIINAAIVIDTLWQARNNFLHNDKAVIPQNLTKSVTSRVNDHLLAWAEMDMVANKIWKPPDPGWLEKVQFENDSLLLVKEITSSPDPAVWNISTQVEFILSQLSQFLEWKINWIPRTSNQMVHDLRAKWAPRTSTEVFIPVNSIPLSIICCDL